MKRAFAGYEQELTLRIGRAIRPFHEKHMRQIGLIGSDHRARGLIASSAHVSAVVSAEIRLIRDLGEAIRNEIAALVDAARLSRQLTAVDYVALQTITRTTLDREKERVCKEMRSFVSGYGLPHNIWPPFEAQLAKEIQIQSSEEVAIRLSELRRRRATARRKQWRNRLERASLLLVGSLMTLCVQWLLRLI